MKKTIISVIILVLSVTILLSSVQINDVCANSVNDEISAKSYVVVDYNNKVLMQGDAHKKREVASICKLMTTLITLEEVEAGKLSLEDKFIVSEYAASAEGSQAFLDAGKEYTIGDLLKSVVVASANDSAIVLAEGIAGSEKNFVKLMNDKANALKMYNTIYANSTGLPAVEQYSTAYDTSILLREVSTYPLYQDYCKIWMDKLTHENGRVTELVNTNRLIKYYPYCISGKTGFTDEAGYCLATCNEKNNLKLICVVLGCDSSADRFTVSINLLNSAYANYHNYLIISRDALIENSILVKSAKVNSIKLSSIEDYYMTMRVGENESYELVYSLPSVLKAPINKGDIIGKILITLHGEVIDSVDIVCVEDIEKMSFSDALNKVIEEYSLF